MKISPLQLQGHVFEEVSIEVELDDENNPIPASSFNFAGVLVQCDVGHADVVTETGELSADTMLVSLNLRIMNADGVKAPYRIKVRVTGVFRWLMKDTSAVLRKDLTVVNGATILYGAIREMVMSVTSRAVSGQLLLPAVNFEDNRPSLENTPSEAAKAE